MGGRWVLNYVMGWVDDVDDLEADVDNRATGHDGDADDRRNTLSHELWENPKEFICRRCGRSSQKTSPTRSFWKEACRGTAAGRALAQHTGNVNEIWHRHHLSKASLIGKGYALRTRSSIPPSMIDEARLAEIIPPDQMADARMHLGFRIAEAAPHGSTLTSSSSSPSSTVATSSTMPASRYEHQDQGRKRSAAELGADRTVRQKVNALEAAAEKRKRGDEEMEHRGDMASRRRIEGSSPMRTQLGDPEPWRRDPEWMPSWLHRDACLRRARMEDADGDEQAAAQRADDADAPPPLTDHHLMTIGPLLFCNRCGAYGLDRAGSRLMGQCGKLVSRDVRIRLERMRQGLHPITGVHLV